MPDVSQLTWADIYHFVSQVDSREGGRPDPEFFRILGRQALGIISQEGRIYTTSWSNASGGDLTLSDNTVTLPRDLLEVTSVEWDGDDSKLELKTEVWLDEEEAGWRSATGEPDKYCLTGRDLILNTIPNAPTTGKVVIRGQAMLPDFSDDSDDPNPLTWLTTDLQLIPAYYILANLPADPENKRQLVRVQQYEAMWQQGLARIQASNNRRRYGKFRY